jgi:hypothetical protein
LLDAGQGSGDDAGSLAAGAGQLDQHGAAVASARAGRLAWDSFAG